MLAVYTSKDGKQWSLLVDGIDISALHHNNLGDFIALRPALCSVVNGKAKFLEFNYIPATKP